MEVKGEVLLSMPLFIVKKFGKNGYVRWISSLSPDAKKVFEAPIDKNRWFPLKEQLVEPTVVLCILFFNKSIRESLKKRLQLTGIDFYFMYVDLSFRIYKRL